jgi:hypothetical protein
MPVGRFWIQLVKLLEPHGSGQGKKKSLFVLFWWYGVTVFFCLFSHVFEEIFMTLGCLKWSGREEIVNGELERSQLVVCTVC